MRREIISHMEPLSRSLLAGTCHHYLEQLWDEMLSIRQMRLHAAAMNRWHLHQYIETCELFVDLDSRADELLCALKHGHLSYAVRLAAASMERMPAMDKQLKAAASSPDTDRALNLICLLDQIRVGHFIPEDFRERFLRALAAAGNVPALIARIESGRLIAPLKDQKFLLQMYVSVRVLHFFLLVTIFPNHCKGVREPQRGLCSICAPRARSVEEFALYKPRAPPPHCRIWFCGPHARAALGRHPRGHRPGPAGCHWSRPAGNDSISITFISPVCVVFH